MIAVKTRDRDPTELIQLRAFPIVGLKVSTVTFESVELEYRDPPLDAPTDLTTHLAKAGPAKTEAWQRPLKERGAVLVSQNDPWLLISP